MTCIYTKYYNTYTQGSKRLQINIVKIPTI